MSKGKEIIDLDTSSEEIDYDSPDYRGPPKSLLKCKYVPLSHKHNPKVKSLEAVRGCVLGLANVTIWEEIMNKMGVRKSKMCAEKEKGKRKMS
ncbi:hypothetical protein Tco_1008984 [Tanacetum coccineum]